MGHEPVAKRWMTVAEAATHFGIGKTRLLEAMKRGQLKYANPHSKLLGKGKGKRLVDRFDLDELLKQSIVETTDVRNI